MDGCQIPEEFSSSTVASASFMKILSPLETYVYNNGFIPCLILISKYNYLIEIEKEETKRIVKLPFTNVMKVVIYHEFEPLTRFVVCLTSYKTAHLLGYEFLEMINEWKDIKDIAVEDPEETGKPKLQIWDTYGNLVSLDRLDFLIGKRNQVQSKGKLEAATALANKVKLSLLRAQSLQAERQRKELFIARKLSDISHQLRSGRKLSETCSSLLGVDAKSPMVGELSDECPLKVLSTRHRIFSDKWIICVNIINASEQCIISELQMIVHSLNLLRNLSYRTRLMKLVQRSLPSEGKDNNPNFDISAEEMEPPILRPKKKAFLIAICSLPDFAVADEVKCGGLIAFKIKSLVPNAAPESVTRQLAFPPILLRGSNIQSFCVDLTPKKLDSGFSFDLLVVIAASVKNTALLSSISTPLIGVVHKLDEHKGLRKIPSLNFYYFDHSIQDPLHYAVCSCKLLSAHRLFLTIYSRDDDQAILVLRNIHKMFPKDTIVEQQTERDSDGNSEIAQQNLISKMYETIAVIESIDKTHIQCQSKEAKSDDTAQLYEMGRKNLESSRKDLECNADEYYKWRESLHTLQLQMESLFDQCNLSD